MSKIYSKIFVILTTINAISLILWFLFYYNRNNHPNDLPPVNKEEIDHQSEIIIETELGPISGFKERISGKEINTFLGIPYAEPPINEFRFKEPNRIENKWGYVFNATKWPNPCIQPDQSLQLFNYNFSEDCLYLNIWSPSDHKNNILKPVVVVIHTGAFIFGSASETKYNGLYLSYQANVVVVTFNYRLNFHGFFYPPSSFSQRTKFVPNSGILDQIEALRWINKNIEYFGGDSNRVTLIGQSSAALSTGLHILIGENLFNQVIMISGSPLQIIQNKKNYVENFWSNYINHLNCQHHKENIIECIDGKINETRKNLITMEMVKQLSLDKLFVNIPIWIDYEEKSIPKNLSILYGYTNDEGSWIAMLDNPNNFGTYIHEKIFTKYQAKNQIESFLDKMVTSIPINKTKIINHYLNSSWQNDSTILHRIITNMLGDRYIVCPIEKFINKLKSANNETLIYQYYWQYKGNPITSAFWSTFERVWCGKWMGSCHSFEMYALFGIPFIQSTLFSYYDRLVSMKMIQIVKYFAYERRLPWPISHGANQQVFYNIDKNDEEFIFGNNFKNQMCKDLWNDYI